MTDYRGSADKSARIAQQTKLFKGFGKDFHVMLFPFNWKHKERLDSDSAKIDVLVIEDSDADVEQITGFIRQSHYKCDVHVAVEAESALSYLAEFRTGPNKILLVLLDLNLSGESGFTLLRAMRSKPGFEGVPVAIISASTAPRDIAEALELEVASYIAKPKDSAQYQKLAAAFDELIFSMFDARAVVS
jgi:CheY-like chemotaxis protein